VWLDFDPTAMPAVEGDLVGVGMRVSAEMAAEFGVFFVRPAAGEGCVAVEKFLQKPSADEIRALEREGYEFWVDTGLWFFGERALRCLAADCGWDEAKQSFRAEHGGVESVDFYAEWAPRVCAESADSGRAETSLSVRVVRLPEADFYHLGTSLQVFESLDALQQSRTRFRKSCYTSFAHESYPGTTSREHPLWLDTVGQTPLPRLDGHNFVSLLPRGANVRHVPAGWGVEALPVRGYSGDGYALRVYRLEDPGKGRVGKDATLFGVDAAAWLGARGESAPLGADVADLPLFPVLEATEITQAWVDWFGAERPDEALNARWRSGSRTSARAMLSGVDGARVLEAKAAGARASLASMMERMAAREEPSLMRFDFRHLAGVAAADPAARKRVSETAPAVWSKLESPLLQARWAMFSDVLDLPVPVPDEPARQTAFRVLAETVVAHHASERCRPRLGLKGDQIVWARCPVRLDLAGGWTDTPPYCFEEGGQVVNVAVDLNGQPPVQVFVRPTVERRVRIRSIDLGIEETVTTMEQLAGYRDARSGFSLAKAALCLVGLHPDFAVSGRADGGLEATLDRLGCGLELSLLCAVPKGSGLGTSSILAATLLGALERTLDLGWDRVEIYRRVLAVEQLLGTGGGWQDQAGGLFGGLKLVSTAPGFGQLPTVRWLPDELLAGEIASGQLLLYYTGVTRLAKDILGQIVTNMFLREAGTRDTLQAIHSNAARMFDALQLQDREGWLRCLRRSWRLNQALDSGSNPASVASILARMGEDLVAGKLLGAGGGGYFLLRARDVAAAERIRTSLEQNPPNDRARFVDFSVSRSGLQVTTS
jgi:galactokinase/mevalonate kinase-like predicted kinase